MTFESDPDGNPYDPHVNLRMPEELLAEVDEAAENRSEFVREAVREKVGRTDTGWEADLPEEDDLRRAFLTVAEMANQDHLVPERAVRSELAQVESLDEKSVARRFVKPLCKRGYLSRISDWTGQNASIRVNVHE